MSLPGISLMDLPGISLMCPLASVWWIPQSNMMGPLAWPGHTLGSFHKSIVEIRELVMTHISWSQTTFAFSIGDHYNVFLHFLLILMSSVIDNFTAYVPSIDRSSVKNLFISHTSGSHKLLSNLTPLHFCLNHPWIAPDYITKQNDNCISTQKCTD